MRVQSLSVTSPRIFEKQQKYQSIFKEALSNYFDNRKYGNAVSEIQYIEILVPDESDKPYDIEKAKYLFEERKITCLVQPKYKKVVATNLNKYGKLIADYYLGITDTFVNLNITDFDLQKFKADLLDFFRNNKLA